MKKILLILSACLFAWQALAVPAKPGRFSYTQPDGSVRELERHGDEFFNWTTDANTGEVVELDMAGYWRPARLDNYKRQQAQTLRRQANLYRQVSAAPDFNFGVRHIPVMLVEFSDVKFSVSDPHAKFDNLLNKAGYSDYQASGSVMDYYNENSHGQFIPVFDVFGPVTLPHEMAYYGGGEGTTSEAALAVIDGAQLLDSQIDFSQYDADNDGAVDMILMYYAGYSEAEGGPKDSIWPHQWYVNGRKTVYHDGKLLSRYFCTAELRGNKGTTLCSIGATCHEFAHALGLPDFYDTDYEENGTCSALFVFSLMCNGCYNDNARTPPFLNAEERVMLGWMDPDAIRELPEGEVTFGPVSDNIAYKSYTDTEGEYFLYECRDGYSWDTPLSPGLLAYHVDKSPEHLVGGYPCDVLWNYWTSFNNLNAFGDHPCFYVVPASDQRNLQYQKGELDRWVFPGSSRVTEYHPIDWDGNDSGVSLFNIRYDASETQVTLSVENHFQRKLEGTVLTRDGKPIQGVYLRLTLPGTSSRAIRRKGMRSSSPCVETTSLADGSFSLDVKDFGNSGHLSALKSGYVAFEGDITLERRMTHMELRLRDGSETEESVICLYDENAQLWGMGIEETGTEMAASLFPASLLNPESGRLLKAVQYGINADSAEELYIIVDDARSGERLLTYKVDDFLTYDYCWADISDAGFLIPGGRDLYIGYAVKGADYPYPFFVFEGSGNYYFSPFDLDHSTWTDIGVYYGGLDLVVAISLQDSGTTPPVQDAGALSELGYHVIDPGTGVYKAGESFPLQLIQASSRPPVSVRWVYDGKETAAGSVTLTAGGHCVECWLEYADGSREVLELPIKVN